MVEWYCYQAFNPTLALVPLGTNAVAILALGARTLSYLSLQGFRRPLLRSASALLAWCFTAGSLASFREVLGSYDLLHYSVALTKADLSHIGENQSTSGLGTVCLFLL